MTKKGKKWQKIGLLDVNNTWKGMGVRRVGNYLQREQGSFTENWLPLLVPSLFASTVPL